MSEQATRNPHAYPTVLSARGKAWVECSCGWLGPTCRDAKAATLTWSGHVLDALNGLSGEDKK